MDQELKAAATAGDIDGIRNLREKINQVTEKEESVLHLAALSSNDSSCVEALLHEFPSLKLDKVNFRNETALHLAAAQGYNFVVLELLNRAKDLESRGELVWNNFIRKANVDGDTALHLAVRNNHWPTVEAIVRADPDDEHSQNRNFETPLYLAATIDGKYDEALKGIDLVNTIIRYCENPRFEGPEGRTALHAAVIRDWDSSVRDIMRQFPYLYQRADNNGWTVFHCAASYNSHRAFDALISEGYQKPDARRAVMAMTNADNMTAHHIAVSKGHTNVLKKLMECCPDGCEAVDEHGRNILHIAAEQRHGELIQSILCDYPDVVAKLLNMQDKNGDTPLRLLVSVGLFVHHIAASKGHINVLTTLIKYCPDGCEIVDEDGRNILHIAAEERHGELIESILCDYPDLVAKLLNMQDKNWDTPLHLLASVGLSVHHIAASKGHINVLTTLIKCCPYGCETVDEDGRNILHIAAEQTHGELIQSILCDYPDLVAKLLNMQDKNGDTPLHMLISAGCFDFVPQFIQLKGVDPTLKNRDNMTAHHIAASGGYINVLTTLIKCCPDGCETVDKDCRNILHIAAEQRHGELIQSILCDYPKVVAKLLNMQDKNGDTPLHLLVSAGCFDFLPQLIQLKGVDPTLRNKENMTAQYLLYVEEEIVGDELRNRNAFVDIQVKKGQKYVRSQESSVPEYKRRRKDTKFKMANRKIMKDEVNLYRARTNTQIIVTALIATVTFTVGFTMPGGNYSGGDANEGLVVLSRKAAFNVCMVANTIGLLFSASSLFLYFISSVYEDPHDVSKFIAVSTGFNIVSVVAMMLTFITGTYAVLSHSPALAISLCAISCLFFLLVILLLIKWKYDPKEKFKV